MTKKSKKSEKHTITAFGQTLTQADAIQFLEQKTKGSACPVCGNASRTIMLTGPSDESSMVITTRDSVKKPEGGSEFDPTMNTRALPVFGLWCSNCGNLQLHTLGTLATWKAGTNHSEHDAEGVGEDGGH